MSYTNSPPWRRRYSRRPLTPAPPQCSPSDAMGEFTMAVPRPSICRAPSPTSPSFRGSAAGDLGYPWMVHFPPSTSCHSSWTAPQIPNLPPLPGQENPDAVQRTLATTMPPPKPGANYAFKPRDKLRGLPDQSSIFAGRTPRVEIPIKGSEFRANYQKTQKPSDSSGSDKGYPYTHSHPVVDRSPSAHTMDSSWGAPSKKITTVSVGEFRGTEALMSAKQRVGAETRRSRHSGAKSQTPSFQKEPKRQKPFNLSISNPTNSIILDDEIEEVDSSPAGRKDNSKTGYQGNSFRGPPRHSNPGTSYVQTGSYEKSGYWSFSKTKEAGQQSRDSLDSVDLLTTNDPKYMVQPNPTASGTANHASGRQRRTRNNDGDRAHLEPSSFQAREEQTEVKYITLSKPPFYLKYMFSGTDFILDVEQATKDSWALGLINGRLHPLTGATNHGGEDVAEEYPELVVDPLKLFKVVYNTQMNMAVLYRNREAKHKQSSNSNCVAFGEGCIQPFLQFVKFYMPNITFTIETPDRIISTFQRIVQETQRVRQGKDQSEDSDTSKMLSFLKTRAERIQYPGQQNGQQFEYKIRGSARIRDLLQDGPKDGLREALRKNLAHLTQARPDEGSRVSEADSRVPQSIQSRSTRAMTRTQVRQGYYGFEPQVRESPRPVTPEKWSELNTDWKKSWRDAPLIFPKGGKRSATVAATDISKLDEGEFLNDSILWFYFRYLEHQLESRNPELAKRVVFMNSYFYEKLTQNARGINYDAVKRWTTKMDLFSRDYIVVPVNEKSHWYVAIICNAPMLLDSEENKDAPVNVEGSAGVITIDDDISTSEKTLQGEPREALNGPSASASQTPKKTPKKQTPQPRIIILDSLSISHSPTNRNLKDFLMQEAKDKHGKDINPPRSFGHHARNIPRQDNYSDCGIYLLAYIERFVEDPDKFIDDLMQEKMADESYWDEAEFKKMRAKTRDLIFKLHSEQASGNKKDRPTKQTKSDAAKSTDAGCRKDSDQSSATLGTPKVAGQGEITDAKDRQSKDAEGLPALIERDEHLLPPAQDSQAASLPGSPGSRLNGDQCMDPGLTTSAHEKIAHRASTPFPSTQVSGSEDDPIPIVDSPGGFDAARTFDDHGSDSDTSRGSKRSASEMLGDTKLEKHSFQSPTKKARLEGESPNEMIDSSTKMPLSPQKKTVPSPRNPSSPQKKMPFLEKTLSLPSQTLSPPKQPMSPKKIMSPLKKANAVKEEMHTRVEPPRSTGREETSRTSGTFEQPSIIDDGTEADDEADDADRGLRPKGRVPLEREVSASPRSLKRGSADMDDDEVIVSGESARKKQRSGSEIVELSSDDTEKLPGPPFIKVPAYIESSSDAEYQLSTAPPVVKSASQAGISTAFKASALVPDYTKDLESSEDVTELNSRPVVRSPRAEGKNPRKKINKNRMSPPYPAPNAAVKDAKMENGMNEVKDGQIIFEHGMK